MREKDMAPAFSAPICSDGAGGALFTHLCMCVEQEGEQEEKGGQREGVKR